MNKERLKEIRMELAKYLEDANTELLHEGSNKSERTIFMSVITLGWAITQTIKELEKDG